MTAVIPEAAISRAQDVIGPYILMPLCGSGYPSTITTTGARAPASGGEYMSISNEPSAVVR